jgi:drug/metabolite transporter (DMT)-like permease
MLDAGLGPVTYTACRFMVSTVLLVAYKVCRSVMFPEEIIISIDDDDESTDLITVGSKPNPNHILSLWFLGSLSGIANFGAGVLMQIGLTTVNAGKAGFITGMYVVFVPIVEFLIPGFGAHLTWKSWLAAIMCLFGLYLISGCAEQSVCLGGAFKEGEALLVGCMFCWVIAIMADDVGAKSHDVYSLVCINFFVCTILTTALALIVEPHHWIYPFNAITSHIVTICTLAVTFSVGFIFTTLGQKYVQPSRASLLMSLESLVCIFIAYLVLN